MITDCLQNRATSMDLVWWQYCHFPFLPTLNLSQPLLANANDLVSVPISQTEPSAVTLVIHPDDVSMKRGENVTEAAYSEH